MKYHLIPLILLVCTQFSVYSQEFNWDAVKKEVGNVARTDQEKAINMLEGARKKIEEQSGKGHPDYKECVQQLFFKYMATGNTEKMTETQQELQLAYETQAKAQAAAQMEQLKPIIEQQQQAAKEAAEANQQNLVSNIYGLDRETTTWADLQQKVQYYIGQEDIATAQNLYDEYKTKLPRPRANNVNYTYVIAYLTGYYERVYDAEGIHEIYKDAVATYLKICKEIEQQYGANNTRYKQADRQLKSYQNQLDKYAQIEEKKFVYPDPSTFKSWKELSKLLSREFNKDQWRDEPYAGIINFYQQVSPLLPRTLSGDYRRTIVTVAKSYKKLGQKADSYRLLDQVIMDFEGRLVSEIPEGHEEREVQIKLLSALSSLYWERGLKSEKYETDKRRNALQNYQPVEPIQDAKSKGNYANQSDNPSGLESTYEQVAAAQMAAISQDSIAKYTEAQDLAGLQAYIRRTQESPEAKAAMAEFSNAYAEQLKQNPAYQQALEESEKMQEKWGSYGDKTQEERLALLNDEESGSFGADQQPALNGLHTPLIPGKTHEHPIVARIIKWR